MKTSEINSIGCIAFLMIIAIGFGLTALASWVTILVLEAFSIAVPGFWPIFGIWFLLGIVANMFRTSR